ncbi:putative proteasome regulatory particle subunit [Eremomyces bilateralis CBS 781.70]|uniref:Proteasome regulatory particle subunit n=1 Tax=Eremomyces bilateralis CBS 781.70 TaxID=1392243 RepID=A0A6G1G933_9PEZI|nr:putative proteasome regulatory particle subunit [Eremomyces bilateralis CBS 781.70]KAF1814369.1 putative proteasome regulatory particle subunit [Eremomyces bilateralis CBS 781.70]
MMASSIKDGEDAVELLLQRGADVTMTNNNGQTALHFTASKNNLDIAKRLIAHKASARTKDKRGQLPLHRAAAIGSLPMIKLLLSSRSPVNATDVDGLTALHHAISEGHGEAAMQLLREGAESDKRDLGGQLPIDLAPDGKIRNYILQSAEREGIEIQQT